MNSESEIQLTNFEVEIPNAERTEIVETVTIQVPVRLDPVTGEETLTADALDLIEDTQAR